MLIIFPDHKVDHTLLQRWWAECSHSPLPTVETTETTGLLYIPLLRQSQKKTSPKKSGKKSGGMFQVLTPSILPVCFNIPGGPTNGDQPTKNRVNLGTYGDQADDSIKPPCQQHGLSLPACRRRFGIPGGTNHLGGWGCRWVGVTTPWGNRGLRKNNRVELSIYP